MQNAVDDILASLDMNQLAAQVGAEPEQVEQAAAAALPALFGGLDANSQDPAGAQSILQALGQHDPGLLDGGVDVNSVDARDGEVIAQHIFGNQTDAVYNQLGSYGAAGGLGGSLFRRLLPILAPIVMSYVMKQMTNRAGGASGGGLGGRGGLGGGGLGGGGLGDILGQVLGGGHSGQQAPRAQERDAFPQDSTRQTPSANQPGPGTQAGLDSILRDVLGGAANSRSSRTPQPQQQDNGGGLMDILGSLLGGGRR